MSATRLGSTSLADVAPAPSVAARPRVTCKTCGARMDRAYAARHSWSHHGVWSANIRDTHDEVQP